jgi:hypothetical protein
VDEPLCLNTAETRGEKGCTCWECKLVEEGRVVMVIIEVVVVLKSPFGIDFGRIYWGVVVCSCVGGRSVADRRRSKSVCG